MAVPDRHKADRLHRKKVTMSTIRLTGTVLPTPDSLGHTPWSDPTAEEAIAHVLGESREPITLAGSAALQVWTARDSRGHRLWPIGAADDLDPACHERPMLAESIARIARIWSPRDRQTMSPATPVVRKRCMLDHRHDWITCEIETMDVTAGARPDLSSRQSDANARKRVAEMPTRLAAYADASKAQQNATRRAWVALLPAERQALADAWAGKRGRALPWVTLGHALPSVAATWRGVDRSALGVSAIGSAGGTSIRD